MTKKLSIIVPVYNVEKYIRPCIESIFLQGLEEKDFEVIIVNDGTKDHSMEVIQDIICLHQNITIINQENQGLSVARNNGIAAAKGEYVLMTDSDDLLIENSLKPLLDKAMETKVDMVIADFLTMDDREIDYYLKCPPRLKKEEFIEKTGKQIIMEDLVAHECYVWRTLYKKDFIISNNLKFYPGITYQDRPFTHACYLRAERCLKTSTFLYIYRKGHSAATSFSLNKKKAFDYCISISETWKLLNIEVQSPILKNKIKNTVFKYCLYLIRRTIDEIEPNKNRIEIIDYLNQVTPQLSFENGLRQRFFSFMIKNMPHTFIKLYYLHVNFFEKKILPSLKHNIRKIKLKRLTLFL